MPTNDATSLKQIQDTANQLGLPMELVQLNPDQLDQSGPAIVYVESEYGAAGQFCVVLEVGERSVRILNGAVGDIRDVSLDQFRRLWTGHAAIPRQASLGRGSAIAIFCMAFVVGLTAMKVFSFLFLKPGLVVLFVATGVLGANAGVDVSAQSADQLPAQVVESLSKIQSQLGQFSVTWQEHHAYGFDPVQENRETGVRFPLVSSVELHKSGGDLWYQRIEKQQIADQASVFPTELLEQTRVCDGQIMSYEHSPWPESGSDLYYISPDVSITEIETLSPSESRLSAIRIESFHLAGIRVPDLSGSMAQPIESLILNRLAGNWNIVDCFHASSDEYRIHIENRQHKLTERYRLSTRHEFVVMEYVLLAGEQIVRRANGRDWNRVKGTDVWIPGILEVIEYDMAGRMRFFTTLEVLSVSNDCDREFGLVVDVDLPGTTVQHPGVPSAEEVPCGQRFLESAIQRADDTLRLHNRQIADHQKWSRLKYLAAASFILIGLVALTCLSRPGGSVS